MTDDADKSVLQATQVCLKPDFAQQIAKIGLTRVRLCELARVHRSTLYRHENQKREFVRLDVAWRLAQAFAQYQQDRGVAIVDDAAFALLFQET